MALRKVFYLSLIVGAYTIVPLILHKAGTAEKVEALSTGLEAFLGLVLSLLLVFRANRAYERWWEARSQWGTLVNVSRNLAIKVHTLIKPTKEEAQEFNTLIHQFCHALLHHLRGDDYKKQLAKERKIPAHVNHLPAFICSLIYEKLHAYKKEGIITDTQFLMIDTDLSRFMHVAGACEKIKNTLISLSYRSFVHHIMIILFVFLPWKVVDTYELWSIPLVILIAYITFALEGIARNLEEPFGVSSDDVHMEQITQGIHKSVSQILTVEK